MFTKSLCNVCMHRPDNVMMQEGIRSIFSHWTVFYFSVSSGIKLIRKEEIERKREEEKERERERERESEREKERREREWEQMLTNWETLTADKKYETIKHPGSRRNVPTGS